MYPRKRGSAVDDANQCCSRRHRPGGGFAVRHGAQRVAELRSRRATTARISGDQLIITLGPAWGATLSAIKSLQFFPYDEGGIEYAAPQTLARTKDEVELSMKLGYQPPKAGAIRGVLIATEQNGPESQAVPIEIAADFSGAGAAQLKAGPRYAPLAHAADNTGDFPAHPHAARQSWAA